MSLFKTREWWTTLVGQGEEFDLGCLCVADIGNKGYDKIIVGSYHGYLRIYEPATFSRGENGGSGDNSPDDVICESLLSLPILQVEAGHFVSGSDSIHIAVLHPRKYAVYGLTVQAGLTDHGKQYQLSCLYEHKLQRSAFNFCFGQFGGVKGRDFTCVQSMDGTLSIFEQETFAFSRFLPGALLPGPIKYVPHTDSFVTVSTSRQVESYKFHLLATATDEKQETQNIKTGKRVTADWTFLINETALDLVVTNIKNLQLTIFVLGERNLYALAEGGQLNFMLKFDFNPSCFLPYSAGKNDTVNCLIGTHAKTLLIYQGVGMKWAAQLSIVPVQIKVANFQNARGAMVTLDEEGHLLCSYLGTDPSVFARPASDVREFDYSRADQEMQQLQRAIKEQQNNSVMPMPSASSTNPQDELKISISVPSRFDKPSLARDVDLEDAESVPSMTVTVSLQSKMHLRDVKLTISVVRPLVALDAFTTVSNIDPGHSFEKQFTVYMKYAVPPTDLKLSASAVYYNSSDAPRVVRSVATLPVSLVVRSCLPVKNAVTKLTVDTNKPPVNLTEIFSDMIRDGTESSVNAIGFKYYGLDPVITILASKSSQRYRIQCDEFGYMWHLLSEFTNRLSVHFKAGRSSDFRLSYESPLPLQEYFELIDRHFDRRLHQNRLSKMLEERASQFRAVQKRLLVMYKDKTPAPMKNLDDLLDSTYKQIMTLAETVEENQLRLEMTSAQLSCATRVLNLLMKLQQEMSAEDYSILESCLSPIVGDSSTQGWEEKVDASITHLLRTTLSKSVKDVTVNPAPLGLHEDTEKIKKHVALFCDRVSKGAQLSDGQIKDNHDRSTAALQRHAAGLQEDFGNENEITSSRFVSEKSKEKKKRGPSSPSKSDDSFYANGSIEVTKSPQRAPQIQEPLFEEEEMTERSRFIKKKKQENGDDDDDVPSNDIPDLDDLGRSEEDSNLMKTDNELVFGL